MSSLPSGTVTFLFTDVERSTQLWDQYPEQMRLALARHDSLIAEIAQEYNGRVLKERGEGDSLFLPFEFAADAAHAALAIQNQLRTETWPPETPIKVRMALHTGEAHERDGDYYGGTVNRCGRIRAVGNGGQILLSEVTARLIGDQLTSGACLRDHGLHHLKDLQRPEHIFELRDAAWTDDFGPLRSLAAFKHNLPLQLTSFVGREQELKDVQRLLGQTRLLTLTGSGGCGKTRLALQTGADVVDDYPDGVWFVELASLTDEELVPRAIANALGIKEEPGRDVRQTLCSALRGQSLLLLLDNCEHVSKAVAKTATTLLQACSNLHILATSRKKLNVAGAKSWSIPALPFPDAKTEWRVEDALNNASLRLFVERATSARVDFALKDANLPAVTRICRRLEGIPLAIELAAARVNAYTPQMIDARLNNFFNLLVGGDSGEKRHETLAALIDWSHDLLSDEERVLLRRLAVFVGGWTLETAETVCEWGELETGTVMNLLANLVDASLVIADEEAEAKRYRLLETVREYAAKKLEAAGETETARDAHLQCFLALAEEAEPNLTGPEQARWLQTLETEHDNLRSALKWAMDGETRLRLAAALHRFWLNRSHLSEGHGWLDNALQRSLKCSPAIRGKALNGIGILAWAEGNFQAAKKHFEACLEIMQEHGKEEEIARTYNNLGIVATQQGDFWTAREYYEKCLVTFKQANDAVRTAQTLNNMGLIALYQEDYQAARVFLEEALSLQCQLDDKSSIAHTAINLSNLAHRLNNIPKAIVLLKESIMISRELGDKRLVSMVLTSMGTLEACSQRGIRAARLLGAAEQAREIAACPLAGPDMQDYEQAVSLVRSQLGEEFSREWQKGRNMEIEEAIAYSLHENPDSETK